MCDANCSFLISLHALPHAAEIELCKEQKEEEKASEERRKTVVVGDMQPLAASLPTITADE